MRKRKIYKVPVIWTMASEITVVAGSSEEALELAEFEVANGGLPSGGEYVEDSLEIDRDVLLECRETLEYESGQEFVADLRTDYGTEEGSRMALRYLEIPLPRDVKSREEEIRFREEMKAALAGS